MAKRKTSNTKPVGSQVPSVEAIRRRAKSKGSDRITLREINREIKAASRELGKKNGE